MTGAPPSPGDAIVTRSWSLVLWLSSVIVTGVVGLGLVTLQYREFMDCSNPELHQSADTSYGWMVAIVASLLPVAVAIGLTGRIGDRLTTLALAVLLGSMVVWQWALDRDCEWSAVGAFPFM